MTSELLLAPCGFRCSDCAILCAAQDTVELTKLAEGWPPASTTEAPDWFPCGGCLADQAQKQSTDCEIYRCCVVDHGLEICSDCQDFPCEKLNEWVRGGACHAEALDRLEEFAALSRACR